VDGVPVTVTVVVAVEPVPDDPEPPHAVSPAQAASASSTRAVGAIRNVSADDSAQTGHLPNRIAERWCTWDTLGLLQQIGAVPAPATA
jgi:hypothetical protein